MNKLLPKLVVSDIGGTLVAGNGKIPSFTEEVFNKIINYKIPVILITGYNYHTTMAFTKDLNPEIILMPQNGTLCVKKNEIIWEYKIDDGLVKTVYVFLEIENLPVIVYGGFKRDFKVLYKGRGMIERGFPFEKMEVLNEFSDITGISTITPKESVDYVFGKIKNIIGDKFQIIRVEEEDFYWIEITPQRVRKDLAIEKYCEENSISLSDVIFFGDNYNDLELLRKVGNPVIVENAIGDLKKEFKNITSPVYEEGVAKYLEDLFEL